LTTLGQSYRAFSIAYVGLTFSVRCFAAACPKPMEQHSRSFQRNWY